MRTKAARKDQMLAGERRKAKRLFDAWIATIPGAIPKTDASTWETHHGHEWAIATEFGRLFFSAHDGDPYGGQPWVPCCWADAERAKAEGFDCNGYSGKWNCHVWGRMDAKTWLMHVQNHFAIAGIKSED